jgi:hypothetical protein
MVRNASAPGSAASERNELAKASCGRSTAVPPKVKWLALLARLGRSSMG